jgi:hypothetical protein
MMTSSMKPRLPATKGLANLARYSSVRASILSLSPMSLRKDDLDRALGAHHRDLCHGPGEVDVAPQMLRAHDVIAAATGLARNQRHLLGTVVSAKAKSCFEPCLMMAPYSCAVPGRNPGTSTKSRSGC